MQMVNELDDAVFEGGRDGEEIEGGEVLDVLAETDAASVGADGDIEFGGEQDDGEVLVDAGYAAAVELEDVDGLGLEELLEHDAVVAVLAGGDADLGDFAADAGVAEDVVGAGGLFHPPGLEFGELAGAVDSFENSPLLVGVDHELVGPADLFTNDLAAVEIVGWVAAYFEFEVRPAFGEGFVAETADLFFAVAEPAYRRGVGGVALLFEEREAFGFAYAAGFGEDFEGFLRGDGVVDVAEVYGFEELGRLHVGEELPEGFVFGAGVEVPDGVDEGPGGEVNHSFFGTEPAELSVVGELAGEGAEVVGDGAECAVDDVAGEITDGLDDEVGAAAESEGEAVAFEGGVGLEDAIGGGVIGVFVDGVGTDLLAGGGKAQVDDAHAGDEDFAQRFGVRFVGFVWVRLWSSRRRWR